MTSMPMGVVVERRDIDNPWQEHVWRAVAVIPGAPPVNEWRRLNQGPGWVQYHAATLPLTLHRGETEAYLMTLGEHPPSLYVVLRPTSAGSTHEIKPHLVTAAAFEAQEHLDAGEDIVERVPMPPGVAAWVQDFVERHHSHKPFVKRKRRRGDAVGNEPPEDPPRRSRVRSGGHG